MAELECTCQPPPDTDEEVYLFWRCKHGKVIAVVERRDRGQSSEETN